MLCTECHGTGYCQLCEGKGYTDGGIVGAMLSALPGDDVSDCKKCGGDGKCPTCGGSGEEENEQD